MIKDLDNKSPNQNSDSSLSPLLYRVFFVASSLLPYLARFLVCFVSRFCFRFAGCWIVDLVMGGAESKGTDITVDFSGWSLWKVLTIFRRCIIAEEGSQVFSSSG